MGIACKEWKFAPLPENLLRWNQTWWRICSCWHCRHQKCILVSRKKRDWSQCQVFKVRAIVRAVGLASALCIAIVCWPYLEQVVVLVEQKGPGDQVTQLCFHSSCWSSLSAQALSQWEHLLPEPDPLFQCDWLRLSEDFSVTLLLVEINLQRRIYKGQLWLNRSSSSHISEDQLISFRYKNPGWGHTGIYPAWL